MKCRIFVAAAIGALALQIVPGIAVAQTVPPQVDAALATLTSNKSNLTYMIVNYAGDKKMFQDVITGTGFANMKSRLDPKKISFGVFEVVAVTKQATASTQRPKYVAFSFVGANVPASQKVGFLAGKAAFMKHPQGISVSVDTVGANDLTMPDIAKLLLNAGGVQKPIVYDFGPGESVSVDSLK